MLTTTFTLIAAAFAIWAIVDIARKKFELRNRIIWFALVILIPIAGPIVYYITGRD